MHVSNYCKKGGVRVFGQFASMPLSQLLYLQNISKRVEWVSEYQPKYMRGRGYHMLKIYLNIILIKNVLLVVSKLLKYPVSFIIVINLFTASSTNFIRSVIQFSSNFTYYTCRTTGFIVDDKASYNK